MVLRQRQTLLLFALALLVLATFWPVLRSEFLAFDDDQYVTSNGPVRQGLSWAGVSWAFTAGRSGNWIPMTWLSHMADVSLFGLNPSGHHATSLFLHVVNTLLLSLLLQSLTGSFWRSALVAALFAVHPAHVESVAWIAERKDVLSATFWCAVIWVYGSWVRKGGAGRYVAVLLLFGLGLMAKPMLVSLPLVLLLLDYWPLGRLGSERTASERGEGAAPGFGRLILEKLPLLLMAAASCVVALLFQRAGGAVGSLEKFPLWARVGNALVSYVRYLGMLFWPTGLAVFYPHPGALPVPQVLAAGLLLLAISAGVILLRGKAPFLLVGWSWFLVTLLPVIGLVQVGLQGMADRYTYIPFIGPFIMIAWGGGAVFARLRRRGLALAAAGAAVLALALIAANQVRYWRDSETLFLHALATTKDNYLIENNLGHYYAETGRPAEALPHLLEAQRVRPNDFGIYNNLGRSLFLLGRFDEAAARFSQALRLRPQDATTLNNFAYTRFLEGEISEAVLLYEGAASLQPEWPEIQWRLAIALFMDGKTADAIVHLRRAVALAPRNEEYRVLLEGALLFVRDGNEPAAVKFRQVLAATHREVFAALLQRGRRAGAMAHLLQALKLVPESAEAHNDLGALLMQEDRMGEAAAEFRQALNLDPGLPLAHNNYGYLLFLRGERKAAIEQFREALHLQPGLTLAQNNLDRALSEGGGNGHSPKAGSPPQKSR